MKRLMLSSVALFVLSACQPTGKGVIPVNTNAPSSSQAALSDGKQHYRVDASPAAPAPAQPQFVPKSKLFAAFLKGFHPCALPLELNGKLSRKLKEEQMISFKYASFVSEMDEERFSRDVGKEFYYVGRFVENEDHVTLVYAVRNVMMGDNAPTGFVLASYNSRGKVIDKLAAGGQINPEEPLNVGILMADGSITVKEFGEKWEKNPKTEGYYENKVVGTWLRQTRHYSLRNNGTFQRAEETIAMR